MFSSTIKNFVSPEKVQLLIAQNCIRTHIDKKNPLCKTESYVAVAALKQSGVLGCCLPCHHHNSQQPPNAAAATYDLICES
jgi:hypothetical protein